MKIRFLLLTSVLLATLAFANCENKLFSFSIKDNTTQHVKIMDVLENITDTCHMTMLFEDGFVKKELDKNLNYINVKDFSLKELLNLLLRDRNLFYTLDENQKILKISYLKTKSYFLDYVSFTKRTSSTNKTIKTGSSTGKGAEDSTTMDFTSDFQFWSKIESEVNNILNRGQNESKRVSKALINQDAGMITVTGTKKQLDMVEHYIKDIMRRLHKEILIEAKLIEVKYTDSKTNGIDWSKFKLSLSGSSDALASRTSGSSINGFVKPNYLIGYNFSMEGLLDFLKTQGDVKIVSNPKVMTLNNQSAVINVGTEVNYRYDSGSTTTTSSGGSVTTPNYTADSTFVGVTLDITPQVTNDNFIMLKINPTVSEIEKEHIDSDGVPFLAPDIKIKQLSSIVKVKDGNKVLIGGLINKDETSSKTSVPLLSSIPLLGKAFQSDGKVITNSELIIVLIPHIIDINKKPDLNDFDIKIDRKYKK
ncbi:pilus (MSHA type) biogenesis protein MshL [Sulfurospirillum sp. 1612]|uniref:pilus (MSHA type) biogenesis protein MshL n=1 Tax=Sulfurospirillum sp. 1612 TaxID=3094835 RepID=UPI002F92670F